MRFLLMFVAVLAVAAPAQAGIFDAFRFRSTPRVTSLRMPVVQGAKKYRVECSNGTCRRIEVK